MRSQRPLGMCGESARGIKSLQLGCAVPLKNITA
jgi:hypothetical protein